MGKIVIKTSAVILITASLCISGCNGIIHMDNQLPSGTPLWARTTVGDTAASEFWAISVNDNSVYIAGFIRGGDVFFGNNVTAYGIDDTANYILVKYNQYGSPLWARCPLVAGSYSLFQSIALYKDNVYAVGHIGPGNFDLGDSIFLTGSSSGGNMIIVKYSKNGILLWAKKVICSGSGALYKITVSYNNIYVTGYFTGTIDFGNSIQLSGSNGNGNPFLAIYDLNGNAQWATSIDSGQAIFFNSIAIEENGIYISGCISGTGTVNFGNSVNLILTYAGKNPYIVKYTNAGIAQWARTTEFTPDNDSEFYAVCTMNGDVYAVGIIKGNNRFYFGGPAVVRAIFSDGNCVIVKYSNTGSPQWARTVAFGENYSSFTGVTAFENSVYACGCISGFSTFGFGNGVIVDAVGRGNTLIVNYNSSGNAKWAKSVVEVEGGTGASTLFDISNNEDYIFAAGRLYNGNYTFGNNVSLVGLTAKNGLLLKYTH
ncbi:MAG: hypothetical protein JXD23_16485 [Spirochaetales bacterium]|nr:hypothetical protein [Spirochaetales bacterium]